MPSSVQNIEDTAEPFCQWEKLILKHVPYANNPDTDFPTYLDLNPGQANAGNQSDTGYTVVITAKWLGLAAFVFYLH